MDVKRDVKGRESNENDHNQRGSFPVDKKTEPLLTKERKSSKQGFN